MIVHLIDGTYELFRHFFGAPSKKRADGQEIAATRSVLRSLFNILEGSSQKQPATHIGAATDHIVESFRNKLYPGYKTSAGIPLELHSQFSLLEETLEKAGFKVWAMTEYEADDALATAASMSAKQPGVKQVLICTPDKDLAQCVTKDGKIVQYDRRQEKLYDYKGVEERYGVEPESIPDYLGLVGDSADGFPGLAGFGAKTAATLLAEYKTIEKIPKDPATWRVQVRGAARLGQTLNQNMDEALLFKKIATLINVVPGIGTLEDIRWTGPKSGFKEICEEMEAPELVSKAEQLLADR